MTRITQTLSRYIASSTLDGLPSEVRHEGVRAFVNWAGCSAGGSRDDGLQRVLEILLEAGGAPAVPLIGRRERLDPLNAALINSMSSVVLSFNDTHFATVAHPTSPVAAALLSLAQSHPLSGSEFVHALILGIEIQCRVGSILCTPPAECQVGLSMQGLAGGIGAAVAAGKALNLDEAGIATAIGHAANQAGGLREAHSTVASSFTPGHAARCGLLAALLAARGVTCSDSMLEGAKGFAVSYGIRPNLDAATKDLGKSFEMLTLAYKPYPAGFVIHPIIDACLDAAQKDNFDAASIERIELNVNPLALKLCNRPDPTNCNQAHLSLQHWAAVSLMFKTAGIAQITEAMVRDAAVGALRRRVVATADPAVGREAAGVRVVHKNGGIAQASVIHCRGSIGRPLTDDDISAKTRLQLQAAFSDDAAEKILAECWRIEKYPLMRELSALLAAS